MAGEEAMVDSLGKISGLDHCYRIETAIAVAAPIEAVWDTATQSEKVGWWFAPGIIETEGGRIQLNFPDGRFGMNGTVKVLFRPHVFEFTWEASEHSKRTIIRFDFVQTGTHQTQVCVTSFVFDTLETAYLVIATWRFMLERLQQAALVKAQVPEDEARVAALIQQFKQANEQQNS